jgi:butyryl-CoA dehydrogenase
LEAIKLNLSLTEEQLKLKEFVSNLVENKIAPKAKEVDELGKFPWENIKEMANQGLLGIPILKEYGGIGMDMLSYCIALEEIAKGCSNTALINLAHVFTSLSISLFGSNEQKTKILIPMAKGEKLGAFGITERTGGSDVASIRTEAKLDNDSYIINGEKSYLTNAGEADIYVILAFTDKEKGSKGLGAFIVEKGIDGLDFGKNENLIGMRGISNGQILLNNCVVPAKNIIGKEGDGLKIVLSCIDRGRIGTSAVCVGLAQGALDASIEYVKKRSMFGKLLSEFQSTQFMIADMATEIEAARLLTHQAASCVGKKERFALEASMAKLYSSEVAMRAAINSVQIHGGYGLTKDGPVEKYMRDAKTLTIAEGTSEIQRGIISRIKLR